MNLESARTFLQSLPHVLEAEQFGGLIYWVGDKRIGGKMFAHMSFEGEGYRISLPVGPARFHEMLEQEGFAPAPYLARVHWVAAERWDVLRTSAWQEELRAAHTLTLAKLSTRTQALLQGPKVDLKRAIAARSKALAEKSKATPKR